MAGGLDVASLMKGRWRGPEEAAMRHLQVRPAPAGLEIDIGCGQHTVGSAPHARTVVWHNDGQPRPHGREGFQPSL